jgi:ppGpp synthetase/RelA/SpoT-type nucleotidyltranferase
LETKLKTLQDKQKNMESKRNYDLEGYINEIALMRKRIKSFEEYVSKLRKMTYGNTDRSGEIVNNLRDNQENFSGELTNFKVLIKIT